MMDMDEQQLIREWGYSPHLAKACVDPFDYAIALVDGTVWRVHEVVALSKDWIRIEGKEFCEHKHWGDTKAQEPEYPFPRGVDVQVRNIIWVADAPQGS